MTLSASRLSFWIGGAVLAAVAIACAVAMMLPSRSEPATPPQYHSGEVVGIDRASNTLTLREGVGPRQSELSVRVRPLTRITHDGIAIELQEVRLGDHATIRVVPPASQAEAREPFAQEIRLARAGESP